MKFKRFSFIIYMACITFVFTGCSSFEQAVRDEYETMRKAPKGIPYRSISNFSEGLRCMDNLIMTHKVKPLSILIEDIKDHTQEVKAGTKDMLISAISEMSLKSQRIKLIAYGTDSANLISFLKVAKNQKPYSKVPLYDIRGSISQFDKKVVSKNASVGLFVRRKGGLGASSSASLSILSMDLSVMDTRDISIVPGVVSKNSISIYREGDSLDADASINKLGVFFDMSLSRSEGIAQALRNLVELAAIELMGKLTKVPYWSCLGIEADNEVMLQELENWLPQMVKLEKDNSKLEENSKPTDNNKIEENTPENNTKPEDNNAKANIEIENTQDNNDLFYQIDNEEVD